MVQHNTPFGTGDTRDTTRTRTRRRRLKCITIALVSIPVQFSKGLGASAKVNYQMATRVRAMADLFTPRDGATLAETMPWLRHQREGDVGTMIACRMRRVGRATPKWWICGSNGGIDRNPTNKKRNHSNGLVRPAGKPAVFAASTHTLEAFAYPDSRGLSRTDQTEAYGAVPRTGPSRVTLMKLRGREKQVRREKCRW